MIPKHLPRFPTCLKAVHKVGLAIWPCVCLYPERQERNLIDLAALYGCIQGNS